MQNESQTESMPYIYIIALQALLLYCYCNVYSLINAYTRKFSVYSVEPPFFMAYSLIYGHIKKNSWLASSPAHKKGPAQDFFKFY